MSDCKCNANYYGGITAPTSTCTACPANTNSVFNTATISGCMCNIGYYGSYVAPSASCTACVNGKYGQGTDGARTSESAGCALCAAGKIGRGASAYTSESAGCVSCTAPSYTSSAGLTACLQCPIGKYSPAINQACLDCSGTLNANQYWSSNGGSIATGCLKATCTNALRYQYFTGAACGCYSRTTSSGCSVANCTNAAVWEYYSGLGGSSAPTSNACPVANCSNPLLPGYYWLSPGLSGSGSCVHARCTNYLSNDEYYSSAGGTDPQGCAVSPCLVPRPIGYYFYQNGFNDPKGCKSRPCTNLPAQAIYDRNTVNFDANCLWLCNAGYYRASYEATNCTPCPRGWFTAKTGSLFDCQQCVAGVNYPSENAVLTSLQAATACSYSCNLGYSAPTDGSIRCVYALGNENEILTIPKFLIVLQYDWTQPAYSKVTRLNVLDETTSTFLTEQWDGIFVSLYCIHPQGATAYVVDSVLATYYYTVPSGNVYSAQRPSMNRVSVMSLTAPFARTPLAGNLSSLGLVDGAFSVARFKYISHITMPLSATFLLVLDQDGMVVRRLNLLTSVVDTLASLSSKAAGLHVSFDGTIASLGADFKIYTIDVSSKALSFRAGSSDAHAGGASDHRNGTGSAAKFGKIEATVISQDNRYVYITTMYLYLDNYFSRDFGALRRVTLSNNLVEFLHVGTMFSMSRLAPSLELGVFWVSTEINRYVIQFSVNWTKVAFGMQFGMPDSWDPPVDDLTPGGNHTERLENILELAFWTCVRPGYDCVTSASKATPCQAGYASDGTRPCYQCEAGTFSASKLSGTCSSCAPTGYSLYKASTACTPCDTTCLNGEYSTGCKPAEAPACLPCNTDNCTVGSYLAGCAGTSSGNCSACLAQPNPSQYFSSVVSCGLEQCSTPTGILNNESAAYYWLGGCSVALCSNKPQASAYVLDVTNLGSSCAYECLPGYASRSCSPCPPGSISPAMGTPACLLCPPGTASPSNASTACSPCEPGSFSPFSGASACSKCAGGTFAPLALAESCQPCQPGSVSSAGAQMCYECQPGFFASPSNATHCQPCGPGTISSVPGSVQCEACPAGFVYGSASASSACYECQQGYFASPADFSRCLPCQPGTASAAARAVSCSPCGPGNFSAAQASVYCSACHPNFFSQANGSSACSPCPTGTFALEPGSTVCDECPAGFYLNYTAESECLRCPAGAVSLKGSFNCTPCSAGYAALPSNMGSCSKCPMGYAAPNSSAECIPCGAGSFAAGIFEAACSTCEEGTFSALQANTACQACPLGHVSSVGSLSCTPCAPGFYANHSLSNESCLPCEQGLYSYYAATACSACPVGAYTLTPVGPCLPCQPGTFSQARGVSACQPCPPATFTNYTAATSCADCPSPPPYSVHRNATGASACAYACAAGAALRGDSCAQLNASVLYVSFSAVVARTSLAFSTVLALRASIALALQVPVARVFATLDRPYLSPGRQLLQDGSEAVVYFLVEAPDAQQASGLADRVYGDDFQASLNTASKEGDLPALLVDLGSLSIVDPVSATQVLVRPPTTSPAPPPPTTAAPPVVIPISPPPPFKSGATAAAPGNVPMVSWAFALLITALVNLR